MKRDARGYEKAVLSDKFNSCVRQLLFDGELINQNLIKISNKIVRRRFICSFLYPFFMLIQALHRFHIKWPSPLIKISIEMWNLIHGVMNVN